MGLTIVKGLQSEIYVPVTPPPVWAPVTKALKDMSIATEEAGRMDIDLPVLGTVLSMYQFLEAEGYGDEGTQALIRAYLDPQ